MAQFRQKLFVIPLVAAAIPHLGTAANVAMIGGSVYGVKQGMDSQKQSEEAAEEQADLMRKQNKILEKAAQANPQAALQGAAEMRGYSLNGVLQAGKIVLQKAAPEIKSSIGMGIGLAAVGYGADKFIQHDIKKSKQTIPEKPLQENYSIIGTIGKHAGDIGKSTLESLSPVIKNKQTGKWGFNGMGTFMNGLVIGVPLMGYYQQKNANKQMANQTANLPYQSQYSMLSGLGSTLKSIGKSSTSYAKSWKSNPGQAWKATKDGTTKFITGLGSFGFGGVQKTQGLGRVFREADSKALNKVGDWIGKNPNAAAWATMVPGYAASMAVWDGAQKGAEKTAKMIDKDAFRYRDSQEQLIQ